MKRHESDQAKANYWRMTPTVLAVGALHLSLFSLVGYGLLLKSADMTNNDVLGASTSLSGSMDVNGIAVQLGPEERIAGPSGDIDTPYFIEKEESGKLKGYTGNTRSIAFDIAADGSLGKSRVILDKGPKTNFDGCGAWILGSIYRGDGRNDRIGWYHAENDCNYSNGGQTHMTMAYMESKDGGETWEKPNYPKNQIITADKRLEALAASNTSNPSAHKVDDIGNGKIIKRGGYYYAFFGASTYQGTLDATITEGERLHVARANVTRGGKPGTWLKWYCVNASQPETCKWNERGIGGKSTAIPGSDGKSRFISWNVYLKRYITVRANGKQGFTMRVSQGTDILNWSPKRATLYPEVTFKNDPLVNEWGHGEENRNGFRQLYAYASVGSIDNADNNKDGAASDETGQVFYLYYAKLYSGQEFDQRSLMRRKVTLLASTTPSRVQLSAYKTDAGHLRMTTELPKPAQGYQKRKSPDVGYLLTSSAEGYAPLYECQLPNASDFYLVRDDTPNDAPYRPKGQDDWSHCSKDNLLVRKIGWISTTKTTEATIPLYNCYNKKLKDRFASAQRDCLGGTRGAILGYMLPALK